MILHDESRQQNLGSGLGDDVSYLSSVVNGGLFKDCVHIRDCVVDTSRVFLCS